MIKNGDLLVQKQKAFIRKADLLQTLSLVLWTTLFCLVLIYAPVSIANQAVLILFILDASILVIAVLRMRKVIANFGMINPNETLVYLHLSFFIVMMISFLVSLVFRYEADQAQYRLDSLPYGSSSYQQAELEAGQALGKWLIC